MTNDLKLTPMMTQWQSCKEKAGNSLLLFRMGDFYEAFFDDAKILASITDVTLTSRQSIPMAGIPFHSAESYIDKLIQNEICVAIAEQIEDPKTAKGLVKRDIVKTITPGTHFSPSFLSDNKNNFFASINQIGSLYGLSFLDLTTGEFKALESESLEKIKNELFSSKPLEFLTSKKFQSRHEDFFKELKLSFNFLLNTQEDWLFDYQITHSALIDHFKVHNLDGFGLKGQNCAINTSGALLNYIKEHLGLNTGHIRNLVSYNPSSFLSLDRTTLKNLELVETINGTGKKETLLNVLDHTATPMGARMLRSWVLQPLQDIEMILMRQQAIEELIPKASDLSNHLKFIKDLQRLMMRIHSFIATPRDVLLLRVSLEHLPIVKDFLKNFSSPLLCHLKEKIKDLSFLTHHLKKAINEEAPVKIADGNVFNNKFNAELDELRAINSNGKSWLLDYQTKLREETQIKTLKVSFTSAFGYFIEVSKGQAEKMPAKFQRRQTLVNNERFTSEILKEFEEKALHSEELSYRLESELFKELLQFIANQFNTLSEIADSVANIDSLNSLALAAKFGNYVKPLVDNSSNLSILKGRHPVIESCMLQETFTPNDTEMSNDDNKLMLLTGPNMAGKSTYIRQVALIVLMAHIGSFVPAQFAHIGIIDKIFTRIGASDDLARGQSTFMVEMSETANILNHATAKSLVILDEIGRGTSTYDGIAIAWSTAEYLLSTIKSKTLFATHYFELTAIEGLIYGAQNYSVLVSEDKEGITFLHKISKGCAAKSYGIHVAKLAGMPFDLIERAKSILLELETTYDKTKPLTALGRKIRQKKEESQMLLFGHV
jgi:DNA mismatch repair protein MutS